MTWRELTSEQLYTLRNPLIIDVRSPCEYQAGSISGAVNVPLLSDTERVQVGTVYAREGEMSARRLALQLISPQIPSIVEQILALRHSGQTLVVYCWRGGLRSEAVSSFLTIIGVDCWRLTGGYKSWRRYLISQLSAQHHKFQPVILDGLTGVGKTEILQALSGLGVAVLDLEGLANHRGSAFGGIGLGAQPTQKNFEAALWMVLRQQGGNALVMEAESRKIGKLSMPDLIVDSIASGSRVLVTGSIAARAGRIARDYAGKQGENFAVSPEAFQQLTTLKARLGASCLDECKRLVLTGKLEEAVKILLLDYYDPLYSKLINQYESFFLTVDGDNPVQAAQEIARWLESRQPVDKQEHLLTSQ